MTNNSVACVWSWVDKRGPDECWPWLGSTDKHGRGKIQIRGRLMRGHQAAYEATYGPIPPGHIVMHECDSGGCCNPAHLTAGTQHENMIDKLMKGRGNRRKLTKDDADALREAFSRLRHGQKGPFCEEMAQKHGVSTATIHDIVYRKSYLV